MSSRPTIRVAVLKGGISAERDVSIVSGRQCASALREEGYDVVELDADHDIYDKLSDLRPDVAFNALHGRWGEDGCVQGILEWMGIPYTHSGVLPSSVAMDKQRAKVFFREAGLPCAESWVLESDCLVDSLPAKPPFVVKPVNEGSSVGVNIVRDRMSNRLPELLQGRGRLMVELYVPGRELTVSVLDNRALSVTDIRTDAWYDFRAKYEPGGSRHVVPAEIPGPVFDAAMDCALTAHKILGCRGLTRSDFRWDENSGLDGLKLLEINTQPGMTPTSLSPEQAGKLGIDFGNLCRRLVEDASCDR